MTVIRKDKLRNMTKVAAAVAKDPMAGEKEIVKETGLGKGTVGRALDQLGKNGEIDRTKAIIKIAESDLAQIADIQEIQATSVKAWKGQDKFSPSDILNMERMADSKQKRYTLLMGANTDAEGAEKQINIVNYADTIQV